MVAEAIDLKRKWRELVAVQAEKHGLAEKKAAIHAAPIFFVRYGKMPGDLTERE